MFDPFDHEDPDLDAAIASAFNDLTSFSSDDDGYQKTVDQLTKLYAIRENAAKLSLTAQSDYAAHQLAAEQSRWEAEQADRPFYSRISPDVMLTVTGNLVVALIVVKYERANVISSKFAAFMKKI